MAEVSSLELLARWRRDADQEAAAALFVRYASRLIALARSQLSPKLARRVDAEDVVQSVCRTFFVRVRDGRLEIQPDSNLWQLLAAITLHKVFGQLEHHTAGKRSLRHETGSGYLPLDAVAEDPSPSEIAAVEDERDHALQRLSPLHRRMVELRLEEHTHAEIATETGRSERMVRLVLSRFGRQLQERLRELAGA